MDIAPDVDDGPNAYVAHLTSKATQNPLKIAYALSGLVSVAEAEAEPDFIALDRLAHRPTDTLFSQQWHLENRGGIGLTAGADVKAPTAWDITRGERSIVVSVIDDGFDTGHSDFSSTGKIVSPFDFGQDDDDPMPIASADNHGTACAGVAVADENGVGVVGLASNCWFMPIRWSGSVSNADIKEQFDHAQLNGADVISCSWGVTSAFFTLSSPMKNSINRAATQGRSGKGCVIVFAAGNENSDVDDPAAGTRSGFAIHPDVIAVAASNSRDKRSHYSNFGDAIWVCAPSSGNGGQGIVTTDRRGSKGYQAGDYTTIKRFGETSSSTPLVSGLCALMLSENPDLTAAEVKDILKDTAVKIDQANGNYDANGHSRLYGYGRVDAHAALLEARRRKSPVPSTRTVQFGRQPDMTIPDDNTLGVTDSVAVPTGGTVVSVSVDVSIRHTFRGDLRLELVGPDGRTEVLFGRTHPQPDSSDDLVALFSEANVPGLANFRGASAQGQWALRIADFAPADLGVLEDWNLSLELAANETSWSASPGAILPDRDPNGVTSDVDVKTAGNVRGIDVDVDVTHSFRCDLEVSLRAPSGQTVLLETVDNRDSLDGTPVLAWPVHALRKRRGSGVRTHRERQ